MVSGWPCWIPWFSCGQTVEMATGMEWMFLEMEPIDIEQPMFLQMLKRSSGLSDH